MADVRIGISGWRYKPWRGEFYPPGLPQRRELEYAASRMNSVEINGSFYSLQRPGSFAQWREATPEGFLFSVKGPRFVTHMKKLNDARTPLANFFASGVLGLGPKLGPVLWQLPPNLGFHPDKLDTFLRLLPRSTAAAAALAKEHDERLTDRALTETDADRPVRHALEVRHATFRTPEFVALLREHDVALVVADTARRFPYLDDVTAEFVYVRLHGDKELYVSGYDDEGLDVWAGRVGAWAAGSALPSEASLAGPAPERPEGRDVFVYFDNDVKVRAPFDAIGLAQRLGTGPGTPG